MATEDITSAGDLPSTYSLMRPPQKKPTGLPATYSDQHGFNLPGRAEEHNAPAGVYNAENALDRYGGDGDDDDAAPDDGKQQKKSSSGSSSSDDSNDDDEDDN